jgi:hypothetical protein
MENRNLLKREKSKSIESIDISVLDSDSNHLRKSKLGHLNRTSDGIRQVLKKGTFSGITGATN